MIPDRTARWSIVAASRRVRLAGVAAAILAAGACAGPSGKDPAPTAPAPGPAAGPERHAPGPSEPGPSDASLVEGEGLGRLVASAGDLDGDGVPDVVATAGRDFPGSVARSGRVRAFSGKDGRLLFSLEDQAEPESLGASVAAAGDMDGDGRPDLLVGAPDGSPGGLRRAGRVLVLSGKDGSLLRAIAGTEAVANLGASVAAAADLDGDGVPDVLAGAPLASRPGLANAGEVRAYSGKTGSPLFVVPGARPKEHFGVSVAALGDLDGDGVPDFAAGAPWASGTGESRAGIARVLSGRDGSVLFEVPGTTAEGAAGEIVGAAGDLDRDGVPDVLVARGPAGHMARGVLGGVVVVSGRGGALLLSLHGTSAAEHFGGAAVDCGDVDRDGVPDLAVGAFGASPGDRTYAGQVRVYSGKGGSLLRTIDGEGEMECRGYSLACAGDLDGDGVPDLLVGSVGETIGDIVGAGRVRAFSGRDGKLLLTIDGRAWK